MSQMIECCKMPLLYHSFLFICGYPRICTIEIIRIQFSFQDKYIPYLSKWFNFILPYAAPDVLLLLYLWCISLPMVESRPELVPVSFLALWFNSLVDTACFVLFRLQFPLTCQEGRLLRIERLVKGSATLVWILLSCCGILCYFGFDSRFR